MGWRPLAVAVAGLAVAIAAEATTYLLEEPALAAGDALVGLAFLGLGLVAWQRRPASRSGLLMVATGFAWFAGSLAGAALFLHRGPLVHLLAGYPQGRLRSRLEQLVVTAAYVDGAVYGLARQDGVTIALSLVIVVTAWSATYARAVPSGGRERRHWWPPRPSPSSWALALSPAL
jgi:hypothetical protein